jgi:Trk K+ transport system NAD-binding subunit
VAETGTLCLVENEGNGRLSTTAPEVHIAVMGIEKVIPRLDQLPPLLTLLTRSATGQPITTYVNLISGPRRPGEKDGPREVHLILLDNGRSRIRQDPELRGHPALHPLRGLHEPLPRLRAAGRPRLRHRLPGAHRQHPGAPAPGPGSAGRDGGGLDPVRGLRRGLPGADPDPESAQPAARLDLRVVVGNAALPSVLERAGVEDADLLIAVTQSDQTNLCACRTAATLFKTPTKIARLRSADYARHPELLEAKNFAVDFSICPEQIVTDYIVKLIEFPEALQVLEFADGLVSLVAVRAFEGGPLVGHPVSDMRRHLPGLDARIAAIYRKDQPIVPEGDTLIEAGDEVFCLAATRDIRQVMSELRRRDRPTRRILIGGGGNIGERLAIATQGRYQVKVIESTRSAPRTWGPGCPTPWSWSARRRTKTCCAPRGSRIWISSSPSPTTTRSTSSPPCWPSAWGPGGCWP